MDIEIDIIPQLKSDKSIHRAWSMYDWANSAYNLVITSTIFPAYYIAITTLKDTKDIVLCDIVLFFGQRLKTVLYLGLALYRFPVKIFNFV